MWTNTHPPKRVLYYLRIPFMVYNRIWISSCVATFSAKCGSNWDSIQSCTIVLWNYTSALCTCNWFSYTMESIQHVHALHLLLLHHHLIFIAIILLLLWVQLGLGFVCKRYKVEQPRKWRAINMWSAYNSHTSSFFISSCSVESFIAGNTAQLEWYSTRSLLRLELQFYSFWTRSPRNSPGDAFWSGSWWLSGRSRLKEFGLQSDQCTKGRLSMDFLWKLLSLPWIDLFFFVAFLWRWLRRVPNALWKKLIWPRIFPSGNLCSQWKVTTTTSNVLG